MRKKVTVIGAGQVGATVAQRLIEKNISDVVLLDVVEGLAQGKALDIMESSPIESFSCKIVGTSDYSLTENSDIMVITAGISRKPGMSREDLLFTNAKIVEGVVKNAIKFSKDAIFIVVTNPVDVMSYLAFKVSGLPREKVLGMAGVLDSSRFRHFIAEYLKVSPLCVEALVLGSHGDLMVPLPRYSTVQGVPVVDLIEPKELDKIIERTKNAGAEIVSLLKTGSAYYAPSSGVVEMVKSIIYGERKILPCSVYLDSEYGIKDVFCGVPVRLSFEGIEEIVKLSLTEEEIKSLNISAMKVRENIDKLRV